MILRGACHCGNLSFTLDWAPDPAEIPARACDCSFCTRHGNVWTAYPHGLLRIAIRSPEAVAHYAFETKTADFHICTVCGVVPIATSRIDATDYAVVNVNTFENVDPALLRRMPATFDAETEDARLARRKRNWIANVEFR